MNPMKRATFKTQAVRVLIALDQILNCLIRIDGEWGTPDETLSARAFRVREQHPGWQRFIDRAFFWDKETRGERVARHCELSYESELFRLQLPKVYRDIQANPESGKDN